MKCLCAAALTALLAGSPTPTADDAYEKLMERALGKAQDELEKNLTLRETRRWATAWQVPSKHYLVRTVDSYAQGKALGMACDQMAPLMAGLIKPDFRWPATKMQVWVVPDTTIYNQVGNAGGDAHSSIYESHFSAGQNGKPTVALHQDNDNYLKILTTHSLVHQLIDSAYPGTRAPAWIQEGLCSYFSLYWNWNWGKSELARFKKGNTQIPLRFLLARNTSTYGRKAHQHFMELGMFFNYLLHYREDTRSTVDANKVHTGPFAEYVRLALAGKSVADHAVHKLIFRKMGAIEKEFRAQKF